MDLLDPSEVCKENLQFFSMKKKEYVILRSLIFLGFQMNSF